VCFRKKKKKINLMALACKLQQLEEKKKELIASNKVKGNYLFISIIVLLPLE